jgi:DNA-binding MarR family transcriptional regulator
VSRQHIQVVVNGLLEDGLVELRPNPDHIRSHLVALTAEGEERITGMLAKETEVLGALDLAADERALWETASVLASIRRALEPITNSPT